MDNGSIFGTNTGHGHIWARPDGMKARCGGPGLCAECAVHAEQYRQYLNRQHPAPLIADDPLNDKPEGETPNQQRIRLAFARLRYQIWRNNSGAFEDKNGRWVRYGLANDSKQLNEKIKSSDLIGIVPVTITPEMVGKTIGVFCAIETKKADWKFMLTDKRAVAQNRFHELVRELGGIAGFARDVEEANGIVGKFMAWLLGRK